MTWYKTGTVNATQGSNAIIGTGTAFISNSRVGDAFRGPDGEWYEVINIASDTAMSISPNYQGVTTTSGDYAIAPMQGYVKDTADALRAASLVIGNSGSEAAAQVALAKGYAEAAEEDKDDAALSATNAAASESTAVAASTTAVSSATSATNSATLATTAAVSMGRFLTPKATLPTTRDDGSPLQVGDKVLNTTNGVEYVYKATGWVANNIDTQQLASSTGSSLVGHNTETVATALTRAGVGNEFAWGNIKGNTSDYSTTSSTLGPDMTTLTRTGFDASGVHGAGTVGSLVGPVAGNNTFGYYLVELVIRTTAKGYVNVLFDNAPLIGDHPQGYPFVVGGVTTVGIENNRAIDDVTYTFMYETSGSTFSQIKVQTDTAWAGQITSIKLFSVTPMKFAVGGAATGNGPRNPFGLKGGGYARNDIALGDKFTLGAFYPDDGLPKTPAHNVANGAKALASCRNGDQNTAAGTYTLQYNETSNNTGFGYSALKLNTKGRENNANGYKSLTNNTVGSRNNASGFWALGLLVDGDFNTGTGWYAGRNLASGSSNTYTGARAGFSNTGGTGNTYTGAHSGYGNGAAIGPYDYVTCTGSEAWAFGLGATAHGTQARVGSLTAPSPEGCAFGHLADASGDYGPTAIGYKATASGSRSTAVGEEAKAIGQQSMSFGALAEANADYTVALGAQAGRGNTGARNTFIGPGAGAATNTFSNITAIGSFSQVTGNNQIQLGDSSTVTYVYGTVQNRSDSRDKADIRDTTLGLAFIESLRPVDYRWDMREDYVGVPKDGSKKRVRMHHGFIAQEVQKTTKESGVEFGGHQDHLIDGGKDVQSLGYDEFIAPLTRAIQELSAMVKAQALEIEKLKVSVK